MSDQTSGRAARFRPVALRVLLYVLLVLAVAPLVFPFLWMASSALKPPAEIFSYPPRLIPQHVAWENLSEVFRLQPFARQIWNSVYIAAAVTALTCALSLLSGYAFARLRFPGRNLLFFLLLSALMLPAEVTLIPLFKMLRLANLVDTHVPLIILPVFGATGVMATFLIRQFFQSLPPEVEEAAQLDGLGRLGIIWHIAMPLARPMLGAVAIIAFLASWNSYLEPLVFLNRVELFTVPVAITAYTDATGHPLWNVQMAATAISTLPVLLAYVLARRQITDSLAHANSR
ncbi:carbohydrate ABC transporter permease [Micromonospora avicenniae]|uniref:carbohydrate ABC transporter permease n=1 Tax=Micromonospora avicenniae TaxID=1198245 RepID=UPI001FEAC537|nr:carbohydrate ABC transporter permease [Micromonospora avicenniae]